MFISTKNKGFQLTFDNGLTISVQYGKGNYCTNRSVDDNPYIHVSNTAEIAIWDKENKEYQFKEGGGSALGWQTSNEVAQWIEKVSKAKDLNDIK
jgi:hypothetical protein